MSDINNSTEVPWDIVFLPAWVHKKISVKSISLIPAFLFVGIFDMAFSENIIKAGFFKGNLPELIIKLLVFLTLSMIIGVIDVVCTMIPIAEFAMMIGKRTEKFVHNRLPIILMKSYSISHLLFIVPMAVYIYSGIDWATVNMSSTSQVRILFSVLLVLLYILPFVQLGFIHRTISVKTKLKTFEKFMLILAAYFWMQISGGVVVALEAIFTGFMERLN